MCDILASSGFPPRERKRNALVENETAEYGKTTVQRNCLSDGQTAHTQRKRHRGEGAQRHDGDTSQEGTTHIQILVILRCSPHVRKGTDDTARVKRGPSQQCGRQEE